MKRGGGTLLDSPSSYHIVCGFRIAVGLLFSRERYLFIYISNLLISLTLDSEDL